MDRIENGFLLVMTWEQGEARVPPSLPPSVDRKDRFLNTDFQGGATDYTEPRFPREAPWPLSPACWEREARTAPPRCV